MTEVIIIFLSVSVCLFFNNFGIVSNPCLRYWEISELKIEPASLVVDLLPFLIYPLLIFFLIFTSKTLLFILLSSLFDTCLYLSSSLFSLNINILAHYSGHYYSMWLSMLTKLVDLLDWPFETTNRSTVYWTFTAKPPPII